MKVYLCMNILKIIPIGVGRFRIFGGGARFRILGGQGGPNSQQAHDITTSHRRHVPTRFLINQCQTRTVRKSDYTPALALPKHMAGIFDEKCREKEKHRGEQIGSHLTTCRYEPVYQI